MSSQGEKDYYSILDVSPSATLKDIKRARNVKLKFYHPDRFLGDPEMRLEAERRTKAVNAAYEVLSDPGLRAEYDRHLGYSSARGAELARLYARADGYFAASRWQESIDILREILDIDPGYRDAAQKLQQAKRRLEQETYLDSLYEQAMRAMQQKSWQTATDLLTQVLRIDGQYRDAAAKLRIARKSQEEEARRADLAGLYVQAITSIKAEEWDRAIRVLEEIIGIDPNYADANYLLSKARKEHGAVQEERRRQQKLAQLYNRAMRYYGERRWQAAITLLEQAGRIDPDYRDATSILSKARRAHKEAARQQELARLYQVAKEHYDNGHWQEAIDLFIQVLREQPGYSDTKVLLRDARRHRDTEMLYDKANEYIQKQQWTAAIRKLEEIQGADPNYKDVTVKLRGCRQALEEKDKQQELARLYALAVGYYNNDQWRKAVDFFGQVLGQESSYRNAAQHLHHAKAKLKEQDAGFSELYSRAELELASGEWQAALAALNTIYQIDPEYRDVKVRIGQAQAALRREQPPFLWLRNLLHAALGSQLSPNSAKGTGAARDASSGGQARPSSAEPQGTRYAPSASDSSKKLSIWVFVGILGLLPILACVIAVLIMALLRTGSPPEGVLPTQVAYQSNTVAPTRAAHQINTMTPALAVSQTNTVYPTQAVHQTNTAYPTRAPAASITTIPASTRPPATTPVSGPTVSQSATPMPLPPATLTSIPAPTPVQEQVTAESPVAPAEEAAADQIQFPAPTLVAPQDGQAFTARDSVLLRWNPVDTLPADAYYQVTLAYTHFGETWYDDIPWLKEPQWIMSEHAYLQELSDDGLFRWSVQLMRKQGQDTQGNATGTALSPMSEGRTLIWRESGPSSGGPDH